MGRHYVPRIYDFCPQCGGLMLYPRFKPRKFCSHRCAQLGANNSFFKHGLSYTREYGNARSGRYYRRHPDRVAAHRHKRRALAGTFTEVDIAALLRRQHRRCALCRTSIARGYQIDHIVPVSKGGSNWPANLQLLCRLCNLRKFDKDQAVFARSLGWLL